ncbi:MAG: DUF11 domain-containing protein [Comamonadaceae bacterium]|nr:MAG: DUF11 domain-containing protein [Comamonadaceae bacterium]
MTLLRHILLAIAFGAALLGAAMQPARAALQASPAWWGAAAAVSSAWHYRVPLTVPAGTVANNMAVVNVDFAALLASLGASGTLDVTSPRVVDANGSAVPTQEFTDTVYNGATDPAGNGRGEVRFLAPSNATAYWLYFDILENGGPKGRAGITPIGGNFENAVVGSDTVAPAGWALQRAANAIDSRVVDGTDQMVGTNGTVVGNGGQPRLVDGAPRTGGYSFLLGARSGNDTTGTNVVQLSRTIVVPATNAGQLRIRFRVQGWDSGQNGNTTNYDYLTAVIVRSNNATTNLIGPATNTYNTLPFSPNRGDANQSADNNDSGYGQYNGYDMNTGGGHEFGMTGVSRGEERWWEGTWDLSTFAGQTITLRFATRHTEQYRSWWHLDDIEWSTVTASVGTPQGFGAVLELPAATPTIYPGQPLQIRARLDGQGQAGAIVAKLYRPDSSHAGDVVLFNDGSHGDGTAADALWTNNGSADSYTFGAADATGTWTVKLYAADGSTPLSGQPAGLLRVVGQATTPVDGVRFSNVDVKTFNLAALSLGGRVYRDSNRNATSDSGEPAAPGMYVKLVQGGTVLQVATPDGNGAYVFNGLGPGAYSVVQSTNNAIGDASASVPPGYVQSEPVGGGARSVTLTAAGGNATGINFGQYPVEARLTGKVFVDNGAGGAVAIDGVQAGSEGALAALVVSLLDGAGTALSTALTRGDGGFELSIPAASAGSPLTLAISQVSGHDLVRMGVGTTGGTASLPARTLVFTPAAGTDYAGVTVSFLPVSTLVQGQARTVRAGTTATYVHRFQAAANGAVSFSLSSQPPASLPGWAAVLYRDFDCNGAVDGGDAPLSASVAVQAGDPVCAVVQDAVPAAASVNMANRHQLSATLAVAQGAGYAGAPITNLDVTTVGAETGAGLTLTKAVRNLTTVTGWDTNGQAVPGQTLQYRLSFRNDTPSPITSVQVNDFLPAYAVFVGAACGPMPAGLACAVTQSPAPGAATGAIRWTFTGSLAPGAAGEVTFDWTLVN